MQKTSRTSSKHFFWNLRGITVAGILALIALPSIAAPFAYVGRGGDISVIDTATNTETATIAATVGSLYQIEVHPSGDLIYAAVNPGAWSLGALDVYDTSNNSKIATIPVGSAPLAVAVHPSGNFVYVVSKSAQVPSGSGPGIISVIDTSTNTVSATIELALDLSQSTAHLAVHPTENILYVGASPSFGPLATITAFDTNTLQPVATINSASSFNDLAIHPSGQYIYTTGGAALQVIDTTTNSVIDSIAINSNGYNIAVHPDGNTIYVANYTDSSVSVVDTNTNTMTTTISTSYPTDLSVHPSGDFVYVTGFSFTNPVPGYVSAINTANNQTTDTISTASIPYTITIGPTPEPVGGAATGISAISVTCTNSTSGQSVSIGLGNATAWDCESSGLLVNTGDSIEMVVTGNAD